jgi:hypothetical protein
LKPEIVNGLFALGGALIGVLGAWLIARSGKEKQRVTLLVSPCSKLLEVGDLAKSDVKIIYRDTAVKDLGAGEFATQNTGTKALEKIEIDVTQSPESPLLDLEITSTNFSAADDFINIEKKPNGNYKITVQYLNPKDRVVFNYRIAGTEKPEFSIRKLGLDVEMKQESLTLIPDIYADVAFGIIENIPLPGYSWLFSQMHEPYRLYQEAKRKNV